VSNCRGPRACALVLATFGLAAGCGEEPREHEPHAETQAQLDPHHAASHREACVDDVTLSEDALARYGIAVEPVQAVTLTPKVSAPGHLALPQGAVARVGSPLSGRIVALPVRSGDAVARGDTLSAIAKKFYGNANTYMKIFEANKPMLKHPDKIYPGQLLRIPPA